MAKKTQWTQVGKRKLEISNLEKELYPDKKITKAEIIQYYLKIAPTLLNHIKGRALTLIRFPEGIQGESFYQKNKPAWAPDWVEFVTLGSTEKKDYILATEPASLVWLANLAALELHQLHSRKPAFDKPDYMVFDLDPPEGEAFEKVKKIALDLKQFLEGYGYHPFAKTTGGKGIHVCVPIEPKLDFSTVFEAAQVMAKAYVEKRPKELTLHIKKESRKGRMLIDIYRIRQGQSIICPYSLRARPGAPVSMPLTWEVLAEVKSPLDFNMHTALEKVLRDGDAWEGIDAFATPLHTQRKALIAKELPTSKKHKTPGQLETYDKKRDFTKTTEPLARILEQGGTNFVVHRHHATNLHYDLRLEQDGVLKSWAVPRGLPPLPGIKRLAVQTEDHPMAYLTFDGKIPKGEYGGGNMWIYALGKYQVTKQKKDGFYFRLSSRELNGEFRIHQIKAKEWLLERVDIPQVNYLNDLIEPMLADRVDCPPTDGKYIYEVKWDGIRAMLYLHEGQLMIRSRNQNDITAQFPELQTVDNAFRANCGLFDAEIVCLDESGKPDFKKVIKRLMATGATTIEQYAKTNPVHCYIFDCLYLDGRSLVNEPLLKRKEWLNDTIKRDLPYRVSEFVEDGLALFAAAREHNLEGIMAKRKEGRYLPGKRSDAWLKIKVQSTRECLVIGYSCGKGNRMETFGGLHLAEREGEKLVYRGKVGTGFTDRAVEEIYQLLLKLPRIKKPVTNKVLDDKVSIWVKPALYVEVSFSSLTPHQIFREPVFVRLRPDLI